MSKYYICKKHDLYTFQPFKEPPLCGQCQPEKEVEKYCEDCGFTHAPNHPDCQLTCLLMGILIILTSDLI